MYTVKPLDLQEVLAAAAETGAILTVEEHNITGGLGTAVAEVLSRRASRCASAGTGCPTSTSCSVPRGAVLPLPTGRGGNRREGRAAGDES